MGVLELVKVVTAHLRRGLLDVIGGFRVESRAAEAGVVDDLPPRTVPLRSAWSKLPGCTDPLDGVGEPQLAQKAPRDKMPPGLS